MDIWQEATVVDEPLAHAWPGEAVNTLRGASGGPSG